MKRWITLFVLWLMLGSHSYASVLGDAANALSAGQWGSISTTNINTILGNTGGSSGFVLTFTNEMVWDPTTRRLLFVGMDHNQSNPAFAEQFIVYDEATNAWSRLPTPPWNISGTVNHGYDHMAINVTGRLFYKRAPYDQGSVWQYNLDQNPATGTWTQTTGTIPNQGVCCSGVEYFPPMAGLIAVVGVADSSIVGNNNSAGIWRKLDSGSTWTRLNSPNTVYLGSRHNIAKYSAPNNLMIFAGGNSANGDGRESRNIYTMNAAGTITQRGQAPVDLGQNVSNPPNASVEAVDPVTGNLMVLAGGRSFYRYNPSTDVWTLIASGSANVPPFAQTYQGQDSVNGMAMAPINTYGVTAVLDCDTSTQCNFRIWKEAAGGGGDPTPPTVSMTAPSNGATVSGASVTVSATAADNVGVLGVQFKVDGTNIGAEDTASPYSITWNSTTIANGSHSLTGTARDAAGNVTTSTAVSVTVTNAAGDTTFPTVSMTAPSNGATVSGSAVAVSATAADNVGVVGVQFKLDGANIQSEDTLSPYSISWNASTASNGTHSLTATARDAAGNSTTSTAISVTVTGGAAIVVGGYPMTSLQNEKDAYTAMGLSWNPVVEPNYPADASYSLGTTDFHGDVEADDLWVNVMQYRRTNQAGYLSRVNAWANFEKTSYYDGQQPVAGILPPGSGSASFLSDVEQFGSDHQIGIGLLALYEHSGNTDTAALNKAIDIGDFLIDMWSVSNTNYSCMYANGCIHYGLRMIGRHLLIATRLYQITGTAKWATLRDFILGKLLTTPEWSTAYGTNAGMYFMGQASTDAFMGPGAYAAGGRVVSTFHLGIIMEAFHHVYRQTGNTQVRDRMRLMARFADQYGLDPTYNYTASVWGIKNGVRWHYYSNTLPSTWWDPVYTSELVNTLVLGYKYTGDTALLTKAKTQFKRGMNGIYGQPVNRNGPDTVVSHFVDTIKDSSNPPYWSYNKTELFYTYLLFENGGNPTVVETESGPPQAPTNLRKVTTP